MLPDIGTFSGRGSRNGGLPRTTGARDGLGAKNALKLLPTGTGLTGGADSVIDLLEDERLSQLLGELSEEFDVVLVDTPPLLTVDDAMLLTTKVDAIVLVLQAEIQRPVLHELARQLESSRASALGFVLTGVEETEAYGYGYGGYGSRAYDMRSGAERGAERV